MTITDIKAIAKLGKSKGILTSIDNTFASPVNQKPIDLGIDMVMHSATKYFGGHSDILAGAVASSEELIERIFNVKQMNKAGFLVFLVNKNQQKKLFLIILIKIEN